MKPTLYNFVLAIIIVLFPSCQKEKSIVENPSKSEILGKTVETCPKHSDKVLKLYPLPGFLTIEELSSHFPGKKQDYPHWDASTFPIGRFLNLALGNSYPEIYKTASYWLPLEFFENGAFAAINQEHDNLLYLFAEEHLHQKFNSILNAAISAHELSQPNLNCITISVIQDSKEVCTNYFYCHQKPQRVDPPTEKTEAAPYDAKVSGDLFDAKFFDDPSLKSKKQGRNKLRIETQNNVYKSYMEALHGYPISEQELNKPRIKSEDGFFKSIGLTEESGRRMLRLQLSSLEKFISIPLEDLSETPLSKKIPDHYFHLNISKTKLNLQLLKKWDNTVITIPIDVPENSYPKPHHFSKTFEDQIIIHDAPKELIERLYGQTETSSKTDPYTKNKLSTLPKWFTDQSGDASENECYELSHIMESIGIPLEKVIFVPKYQKIFAIGGPEVLDQMKRVFRSFYTPPNIGHIRVLLYDIPVQEIVGKSLFAPLEFKDRYLTDEVCMVSEIPSAIRSEKNGELQQLILNCESCWPGYNVRADLSLRQLRDNSEIILPPLLLKSRNQIHLPLERVSEDSVRFLVIRTKYFSKRMLSPNLKQIY